MYKKFDLKLDGLDATKLIGDFIWSAGGNLSEYSSAINPYMLLRHKIKFNIHPDKHNITKIIYPGCTPHTDAFPTALNIYLNVSDSNDVTTIWEQKNGSKSVKPSSRNLNRDELIQIGSFVAVKYDCYLLDTSKIHSLSSADPKNPRYILRFIWNNHTFDEVKDSIEIL